MRGMTIGDFQYKPLSFASLADVSSGLNHPELRKWIAAEHSAMFFEAMTKRLAAEMEGKSLLLVVSNGGRVAGICGLSDYPGIYGTLQTSTYLHPDWWGSGLNRECKRVTWAVGHGLFRHDSLVSSIAIDNERSQAALRKSFPRAEESTVYEFWRPREARLFELCEAPDGTEPLSASNFRSLQRMLARVPASQRWLVRPVGKRTRVRYKETAEVLHMENLYTAVSKVLSDRAETVRDLADQVADAPASSINALLMAAGDVAGAAQHEAAERIVEVAEGASEISTAGQGVVADAIVELREETGAIISADERSEISKRLAVGTIPDVL